MENEMPQIHLDVKHKGRPYVAHMGPIYQHEGYLDATFDIDEADVNGNFLVLEEGHTTPVLKVVKNVQFEDMAVGGHGAFLYVDPKGFEGWRYVSAIQEEKAIDKAEGKSPIVTYGKGTTFCYIAYSGGLVIKNTSEPRFHPDMEIEIKEGSWRDELPWHFWKDREYLLNHRVNVSRWPFTTGGRW